jgi:TPR repeat protein
MAVPVSPGPGSAAQPYLAAPAAREPLPEKIPGEEAFLRGDYLTAAPRLLAAFSRGDIRGAFYARIIYDNGLDGRPPDPAAASRAMDVLTLKYTEIRKLATSAPQDLRPLYQTALGLLYMRGRVPAQGRSLSEAAYWLEDAADEGFIPAMNLLAAAGCDPDRPSHLWGLMGTGTSDCFDLTKEAAEAGDTLAMANLSSLYRTGTGTWKDPLMAVEWARKAAAKSPPSARAQNDMGAYYVIGAVVTPDPAEARRWFGLARKRYPLAADNLSGVGKAGFVPAMARNIDY